MKFRWHWQLFGKFKWRSKGSAGIRGPEGTWHGVQHTLRGSTRHTWRGQSTDMKSVCVHSGMQCWHELTTSWSTAHTWREYSAHFEAQRAHGMAYSTHLEEVQGTLGGPEGTWDGVQHTLGGSTGHTWRPRGHMAWRTVQI